MLVKGASALAKEDASRPRALDFGDAALCPNLGESVRKSERGDLTFYLAAIAPRVGPAPAEATVEVLRGGQTLRRLATPLSPPNASGRIQMAAALALEPLTPGAYELKVTVGEGADRASSSASFTLED